MAMVGVDSGSLYSLSHLAWSLVCAAGYLAPAGVPESLPLWYPYLPVYSPQAAAAVGGLT